MKMTITVPDDLYWEFQEALAKRRKPQKEAVAEALRLWSYEGDGKLRTQCDAVLKELRATTTRISLAKRKLSSP